MAELASVRCPPRAYRRWRRVRLWSGGAGPSLRSRQPTTGASERVRHSVAPCGRQLFDEIAGAGARPPKRRGTASHPAPAPQRPTAGQPCRPCPRRRQCAQSCQATNRTRLTTHAPVKRAARVARPVSESAAMASAPDRTRPRTGHLSRVTPTKVASSRGPTLTPDDLHLSRSDAAPVATDAAASHEDVGGARSSQAAKVTSLSPSPQMSRRRVRPDDLRVHPRLERRAPGRIPVVLARL